MQDTVFIHQLEIKTLIGVFEFERKAPQRVVIDLEVPCDMRQAAASDDVKDTIDYGQIVNIIEDLAAQNKAKLLEHFGNALCQAIFDNTSVTQLSLKLSKPDIIPNAKDVGIIMRRQKD